MKMFFRPVSLDSIWLWAGLGWDQLLFVYLALKLSTILIPFRDP